MGVRLVQSSDDIIWIIFSQKFIYAARRFSTNSSLRLHNSTTPTYLAEKTRKHVNIQINENGYKSVKICCVNARKLRKTKKTISLLRCFVVRVHLHHCFGISDIPVSSRKYVLIS